MNNEQPSRVSTESLQDDTKKPQHPPLQPYVYVDKVGTPNPDAQPKKKSRLSAFLSRFQSPAVKATNAARERELLKQERTGVRTVQVTDMNRSANAWVFS